MFHCSDASGRMKIKEISPFDQKVIESFSMTGTLIFQDLLTLLKSPVDLSEVRRKRILVNLIIALITMSKVIKILSSQSLRNSIRRLYIYFFQDLNRDDVMILDCDHKLFLWHGEGANQNEMQTAWETAKVS